MSEYSPFQNVKPRDQGDIDAHQAIADAFDEFTDRLKEIMDEVPMAEEFTAESLKRMARCTHASDQVVTKLREACFWANRAIAEART